MDLREIGWEDVEWVQLAQAILHIFFVCIKFCKVELQTNWLGVFT
jgi:hypothetical protein